VRSVTQVKECGRTFKPRIKHRTPVGKGRGKKTVLWGKGRGRECVCAKRYEMRGRVRRPASGSGTDERKKSCLLIKPGS